MLAKETVFLPASFQVAPCSEFYMMLACLKGYRILTAVMWVDMCGFFIFTNLIFISGHSQTSHPPTQLLSTSCHSLNMPASWESEKVRLAGLDRETHRKEYKDYVPLANIPSWKEENKGSLAGKESDDASAKAGLRKAGLDEKVSLFRGDITKLEVSFSIVQSKIYFKNFLHFFK